MSPSWEVKIVERYAALSLCFIGIIMKIQSKKVTIISSCVLMLIGFIAAPRVMASDDITVSGNGANTNSTVNVSTNMQTNTQQSNNAQVINNTNTTASTGNNSAANSTGNTTIKTGDATVSTKVSTTANISNVTTDCGCAHDTSASITGNGSNSSNTINQVNATTTNVAISQNASLTNAVSQKVETGNNTADFTNGTVTIKTGNIAAQTEIKNGPINIANVLIPSGNTSSFTLKISGNGANSYNTITNNENNSITITVNNAAGIINTLKEQYSTGNNSANYTNGNVAIVTGNIASAVTLVNGPINILTVTPTQKVHQKPAPSPTPVPQPSNNAPSSSTSSSTSTSNTSSGSSSSGPGTVMGASANNLPVTGGSYWFFIALIGNILMMLLGGYLRLRSGRSPGAMSAI